MMKALRLRWGMILLSVCLLGLVLANILYGAVAISVEDFLDALLGQGDPTTYNIIFRHRLPQVFTALLTGIALPTAGMLLQTLFRNPLAGPSIMGVSGFSSLSVALFSLASSIWGWALWSDSSWALIFFSLFGALFSLLILSAFARYVIHSMALLVVGFVFSAIAEACIGFLEYLAPSETSKSYLLWTMGSLSGLNNEQLTIFAVFVTLGLVSTLFLLKPLNALLLGEHYAQTLGTDLAQIRLVIVLTSGVLTAVCTALTGPIVFVGMAIPHLSRMLFKTVDHQKLFPCVLLLGMISMTLCLFLARMFPGGDVPINIITALLGAPFVIYVVLRQNKYLV